MRPALDHLPNSLRGQRAAALCEEELAWPILALLVEIPPERILGGCANGHEPLPLPLSKDLDDALLNRLHCIVERQPRDFPQPHARVEQEQEDGEVTRSVPTARVNRVEEPAQVFLRDGLHLVLLELLQLHLCY